MTKAELKLLSDVYAIAAQRGNILLRLKVILGFREEETMAVAREVLLKGLTDD